MSEEKKEKPPFDYPNWPFKPREGIQSAGNYKYMTDSLFIERAKDETTALYTMSEHELWIPGRKEWLPSAWMIYIHATDEYDALRKLVGNVRHWEVLQETSWFVPKLEQWRAEWAMKKKMEIRELLMLKLAAKGDTAAARTLLQMIDDSLGKKGRPKKPKADKPDQTAPESDSNRVAHLFKNT